MPTYSQHSAMSATDEEINPYELLGLSVEATDQEIKTAYRQRSLKVHPDRVSIPPPTSSLLYLSKLTLTKSP